MSARPAIAAPPSEPPAPKPDAATSISWEPALLERVRKELAVYMGPMAKVLVARTSSKARSEGELYDLLAAEINLPNDRTAFRRAVSMRK
jgi:hypothetical protein